MRPKKKGNPQSKLSVWSPPKLLYAALPLLIKLVALEMENETPTLGLEGFPTMVAENEVVDEGQKNPLAAPEDEQSAKLEGPGKNSPLDPLSIKAFLDLPSNVVEK